MQIGIISCAILLSACGGASSTSSNNENEPTISVSGIDGNAERKSIYQKILSDERYIDGFYQEPENNTNTFYTIKHVSNHDILRYDINFAYPLCDDSQFNAVRLSENDVNPTNRDIISTEENDIFYEISRSGGDFSHVYVQRIYKCSKYEANVDNDYLGAYKSATIDHEQYKNLIEYQWYFSENNNFGNIVLSSESTALNNDETQVVIVNAKIIPDGDCDEVSITENYFDLNHTDRSINRYEITSDIYRVKQVNNTIEMCI